MIGAVHILMGAALGALVKKPAVAFTAGFASHAAADAAPHKDLSTSAEASLSAAALAYVFLRFGRNSPQFAGALGAIVPDLEHAASELGLIDKMDEFFPTHVGDGLLHGPETDGPFWQVPIAALSLLIAELGRK